MERTEPTFVPEWLKNSAGLNTTTSHQLTSSSLRSDERGASKSLRNKSLDNNLGHPSVLDRANSSISSRASINHGSANLKSSYSSFNRNHRDRDRDRDRNRDKDIFEFRNKEKSVNRHHDYSDPLGNILPSRFEKNGLRRSHSSISGKRGESWPKKDTSDLTIVNKSSHSNGGTLLSGNVKTPFERDFPSLGADEKQVDNDIGQALSLGLSSAIQSLPIGNSAMIGGDGWTSALAQVPVIVGSSGNGSTVAPLVQSAPVSTTTGMTGGRNMAETLARGPPRTQTPPELTAGTQRLEELAVKQSRQLIPVTPSMPKALAFHSSDKQKLKTGQSQFQSSHLINNQNISRSVSVKPDVSKTSMGKLLILKPSWERNGTASTEKDSLSPIGGGVKLPNSSPAVPSVAEPAPLKNLGNGPTVANLEKRPSLQAQSRSNFFKLMRKKSMTSVNSSSAAPDAISSGENNGDPVAPEDVSGSTLVLQSSETKVDLTCNGDTCDGPMVSFVNGKNHCGPNAILYPEEEETRFLRSLGWEETEETAEEEGLTEEEINSFYQNYLTKKPASKILHGKLQKRLMPMGDISSNSKADS